MDVLGIGFLELIFILIIILLVAGPRDLEKAARSFGRFLNRLNRSPNYQAIRQASQEIRNLPQRLAREAQLEELRELKELKQVQKDLEGLKDVSKELKDTARTISTAPKQFRAWVEEVEPGTEKAAAKNEVSRAPNASPPKNTAPTQPPAPPPSATPPNGPADDERP